jgi:hypothetical protein
LFVWMDFTEFLPEDGTDDERERALYLDLLKEYGLLFTPGCSMTAASDEEFDLGMDRLRTNLHFTLLTALYVDLQLSQLFIQEITMRRINSFVVVFHQFSFYKAKTSCVKFHGIVVGNLNMQGNLIHIG